jgi:uncharacterized protein
VNTPRLEQHSKPPGFDPGDIEPPPFRDRDWPLESLALDVSGHCNLACRYCAEAASQPRRRPAMDETVLDRAVERLFAEEGTRNTKSIRLGSGEPLLAKNLLQRLAERLAAARQAGLKTPEVFLTTNGTLLDAETRDWLVATGWHVKVSLDGPPAIQNRWRTGPKGRPTYAKVAEAVMDLARRIPKRLSVTAVLCRDSDPAEVFAAIANLGARRIELMPVGHRDPAIRLSTADIAGYRRFAEDYAHRYVATKDQELPELVKVINAARRVMGYDVKRVACGAGRSFFGIGPGGDLYPCFRFIGVEAYRLGDIAAGLDTEAVRRFQRDGGRPYDARGHCRDCWAAPLCGGPCFAEAELLGSGGGNPLAVHCEYVRADATAAIELVDGLRQREPERLLSLLAGLVDC